MTLLARLRSFIAALLRGRTIERDMEAEWRFHVESRADDLAAEGVPRDQAMRQARSEFGDPLRWKEGGREPPVVGLRDMETVFAAAIQRPRFLAQLLGLFAGLALLLAAVGTYGVVSSIVAERRREIGIRMALGADRSDVLAGVMTEGLVLASFGVVVGLAGAFGLNRLIAALLFGVQPTDVSTVAGVAATMMLVAAVACLLPAWRASQFDPSAVLRA